MTQHQRRSVRFNATWAVASVVAAAIAPMITLPLVTRRLGDSYSAWALVAQVCAWLLVLQPGFSQAITRIAARAQDSDDENRLFVVVESSVIALLACVGLGLLVIAVLTTFLEQLFPDIPKRDLTMARHALWVFGPAALLSLPASAFVGLLNGRHRGYVPSVAIIASRVAFMASIVVFAVTKTLDLTTLAIGSAAALVISHVIVVSVGIRTIRRPSKRQSTRVEALRSCRGDVATATFIGLAIYTIANLDVIFVARFDYSRTGAYSIAATGSALLSSVVNSVTSSYAPLLAGNGPERRREDLTAMTSRVLPLLVSLSSVLLLSGPFAISVLISKDYARAAVVPLVFLAIGVAIRQSFFITTVAAFSYGWRRIATMSSAIEATVNLVSSVALAFRYGAPGIAAGTLLGAGAGIASMAIMTRRSGHPEIATILASGLKPLLPSIALTAGAMVVNWPLTAIRLDLRGAALLLAGVVAIYPLVRSVAESRRRRTPAVA